MVKRFIRVDRMALMGGELAFDLRRAHFLSARADTALHVYIGVRSPKSVGNSVAVKASNFNRAQQLSSMAKVVEENRPTLHADSKTLS